MKTLRVVLLGLALSVGLLSGAQAHGPSIGVTVQAGYPVYYGPPPVYYAPPPVVYAPPPVYVPRVVVPSYRYGGYYYDAPRYGWYGRHGYHEGHRHWR
ncbi:MAG: hypothetical protein KGP14_12950 [Betaproteobacteria bacterium]|nr:hypothetical protein [Betaproteobacteria bacterium]